MMVWSDKAAWTESIADTIVGSLINIPMNFVLIAIAFDLEFSVAETSILLSTVFTILAIIRKYKMRLFFAKKKLHSE
jgi:hypothetical protein